MFRHQMCNWMDRLGLLWCLYHVYSNMVTITISKHEYARAVIISVLKLQLQLKAEANLIKKIACITHFIKSVSSWIQ